MRNMQDKIVCTRFTGNWLSYNSECQTRRFVITPKNE